MTLGMVEGCLVAGLVGAAVSDAQTGKIPNALTGPLLLVGLAVSTLFGQGILFALFGAVVGFAIHFPLWVLKVQRGGDAKLLIAAGAFTGAAGIVEMTIAVLMLYLPFGFIYLLIRGRLGNFVAHLRHMRNVAMKIPSAAPEEVTVIVMGPLILVAGLVALLTSWFDLVAYLMA